MSSDRGVRRIPVAEWPDAVRSAWETSLHPGDPLEPGGLASTWSAGGRGIVEAGFSRWLIWLDTQGELRSDILPDHGVTREMVARYRQDLTPAYAPITVAGLIQQLGRAMRAMVPEQDWTWLQRGADRLRAKAVPVRDKRARLQGQSTLVELGMHVMREAELGSNWPRQRAALYRDGLMIAFLGHCPIRRRNLTAIALGEHLVKNGSDWRLSFGAGETKTKRAFSLPFPTELVAALERYLADYRPILLDVGARHGRPTTPALWVSKNGTAMTASAIGFQIAYHTKQAFGIAMRPHDFRNCAATTIAIEAPEEVHLIQPVLGHASLRISEKHYNLATMADASRRYQAALDELEAPRRGKRREEDA